MAQDMSIDHATHAQATRHIVDHVAPNIHAAATGLETSVQAAGAGWKGEAKRSFDKFAANLHSAIQDLHASVNDMTDKLTHSNQNLGTTDVSNADLFGHAGKGLESAPLTNLH